MTGYLTVGLLSAFVRNLGSRETADWKQGEDVALGDIRLHNQNKYIAKIAGRCGDVPPVHLHGEATDGKVIWIFVESVRGIYPNMKNSYLLFGRDSSQPIPHAFYAQKLNSENARLGAKATAWVKDTVYTASLSTILRNTQNQLYICVRADGASTVEPTEDGTHNFQTLDGYIWRYIGKVDTLYSRFISDSHIPVDDLAFDSLKTLVDVTLLQQKGEFVEPKASAAGVKVELNPAKKISSIWVSGSNNTINHGDIITVQNKDAQGTGAAAEAVITSGKVTAINRQATGSGYTHATVFVIGDGTGASAEPVIDNVGAITGYTVTNQGQDYTHAEIIIIAGQAGAVAKAVTLNDGNSGVMLSNTNALLLNITVSDITGYIDPAGDNSKYDYVAIATGLTAKGKPASAQYYAAPLNPNYSDPAFQVIEKTGLPLLIQDFAAKQRTAGQEENLSLTIVLE